MQRIYLKCQQLTDLLINHDYDLSTSEGRSKDRYRRAAMTSMMLISARVLNILTGLATIPITLKYLGEDLFGLWMFLTSFVAFLSFSDLGLGVGVQNALIKCYANDDRETPSRILSTGFSFMGVIVLVLICGALFVLPHLSLQDLVKFKDINSAVWFNPTAVVMVIGFSLGIPAGLSQRICDAYQRGYWGYFFLAIGRFLGFVGVVLCAVFNLPLPYLAGIFIALPHLVVIFGVFVLLCRKMSWIVPRKMVFDVRIFKELIGIGGLVMLSQVGYALLYNTPAMVVSNQVGVAYVAPLAVTQKLLGSVTILLAPIFVSLWGAIGEAAHRNEYRWIITTFKRALGLIVLCYLPLAVLFIMFGQKAIFLWTQTETSVPSFSLLLACIVISAISPTDQLFVIILNAMNRFLLRSITMITCSGIVAVVLYLVMDTKLSVELVVWTYAILGFLLVAIVNGVHVCYRLWAGYKIERYVDIQHNKEMSVI